MVSARRSMEILHAHAHNELTHYAYNHGTLDVSPRYRDGRMAGLKYLTQLATYYLDREMALQREFLGEIERQIRDAKLLCPGGYRKGLMESLELAYALQTKSTKEQ